MITVSKKIRKHWSTGYDFWRHFSLVLLKLFVEVSEKSTPFGAQLVHLTLDEIAKCASIFWLGSQRLDLNEFRSGKNRTLKVSILILRPFHDDSFRIFEYSKQHNQINFLTMFKLRVLSEFSFSKNSQLFSRRVFRSRKNARL